MNRLPIATSRIPETLRRLAYFTGWPDASLANLAAGAKIILLPKHAAVARKNEKLESLHVVVSGLIRLYIPLPNNMERVISLVGPGESLGEACLILEEACPYDAVAGKDSHVLVIDALVFRRELSGDIALTRQTLERMARRFMETLRDTEICAQRSSVPAFRGWPAICCCTARIRTSAVSRFSYPLASRMSRPNWASVRKPFPASWVFSTSRG